MVKRSVKVLDTRINYYVHGRGQPLVFIHGHRSDALRWQGIILFLAKKFKVYAPDLPGFGQSPQLKKPHTMDNYALYMNKFVEKLGFKNYVLFGGSMGGIVALKMLIQKPKIQPQKLILGGTLYSHKYFKISWGYRILIFLAKHAPPFLALGKMIVSNDFLLYKLLYYAFPEEDRKKEIVEYEMKQWRVMPMEIWLETGLDLIQTDFSGINFRTNIPTLILSSKLEQYFDFEKTIAGLQKICPNNRVSFLPFNGHVPKGELKTDHLQEFEPLFKEVYSF